MSRVERTVITAAEARKRRTQMLQALTSGLTEDEILELFSKTFGMTDAEISSLRDRCSQTLLEEYEKGKPYAKAAACFRIQRHIFDAAKRNQYGAVANLESQLSRIQGTEAAQETTLLVDVRVRQAVMNVLQVSTPGQLQELIDEEVALLQEANPPPSE